MDCLHETREPQRDSQTTSTLELGGDNMKRDNNNNNNTTQMGAPNANEQAKQGQQQQQQKSMCGGNIEQKDRRILEPNETKPEQEQGTNTSKQQKPTIRRRRRLAHRRQYAKSACGSASPYPRSQFVRFDSQQDEDEQLDNWYATSQRRATEASALATTTTSTTSSLSAQCHPKYHHATRQLARSTVDVPYGDWSADELFTNTVNSSNERLRQHNNHIEQQHQQQQQQQQQHNQSTRRLIEQELRFVDCSSSSLESYSPADWRDSAPNVLADKRHQWQQQRPQAPAHSLISLVGDSDKQKSIAADAIARAKQDQEQQQQQRGSPRCRFFSSAHESQLSASVDSNRRHKANQLLNNSQTSRTRTRTSGCHVAVGPLHQSVDQITSLPDGGGQLVAARAAVANKQVECIDNVHFNDLFHGTVNPDSTTTSITVNQSVRTDPRLHKDDVDIKFSRALNSCKLPQIRYASKERLFERLTDLRFLSIDFLNTFLLTYRVFTTAHDVLEAIKSVHYNSERYYNQQQQQHHNHHQQQQQQHRYQQQHQLHNPRSSRGARDSVTTYADSSMTSLLQQQQQQRDHDHDHDHDYDHDHDQQQGATMACCLDDQHQQQSSISTPISSPKLPPPLAQQQVVPPARRRSSFVIPSDGGGQMSSHSIDASYQQPLSSGKTQTPSSGVGIRKQAAPLPPPPRQQPNQPPQIPPRWLGCGAPTSSTSTLSSVGSAGQQQQQQLQLQLLQQAQMGANGHLLSPRATAGSAGGHSKRRSTISALTPIKGSTCSSLVNLATKGSSTPPTIASGDTTTPNGQYQGPVSSGPRSPAAPPPPPPPIVGRQRRQRNPSQAPSTSISSNGSIQLSDSEGAANQHHQHSTTGNTKPDRDRITTTIGRTQRAQRRQSPPPPPTGSNWRPRSSSMSVHSAVEQLGALERSDGVAPSRAPPRLRPRSNSSNSQEVKTATTGCSTLQPCGGYTASAISLVVPPSNLVLSQGRQVRANSLISRPVVAAAAAAAADQSVQTDQHCRLSYSKSKAADDGTQTPAADQFLAPDSPPARRKSAADAESIRFHVTPAANCASDQENNDADGADVAHKAPPTSDELQLRLESRLSSNSLQLCYPEAPPSTPVDDCASGRTSVSPLLNSEPTDGGATPTLGDHLVDSDRRQQVEDEEEEVSRVVGDEQRRNVGAKKRRATISSDGSLLLLLLAEENSNEQQTKPGSSESKGWRRRRKRRSSSSSSPSASSSSQLELVDLQTGTGLEAPSSTRRLTQLAGGTGGQSSCSSSLELLARLPPATDDKLAVARQAQGGRLARDRHRSRGGGEAIGSSKARQRASQRRVVKEIDLTQAGAAAEDTSADESDAARATSSSSSSSSSSFDGELAIKRGGLTSANENLDPLASRIGELKLIDSTVEPQTLAAPSDFAEPTPPSQICGERKGQQVAATIAAAAMGASVNQNPANENEPAPRTSLPAIATTNLAIQRMPSTKTASATITTTASEYQHQSPGWQDRRRPSAASPLGAASKWQHQVGAPSDMPRLASSCMTTPRSSFQHTAEESLLSSSRAGVVVTSRSPRVSARRSSTASAASAFAAATAASSNPLLTQPPRQLQQQQQQMGSDARGACCTCLLPAHSASNHRNSVACSMIIGPGSQSQQQQQQQKTRNSRGAAAPINPNNYSTTSMINHHHQPGCALSNYANNNSNMSQWTSDGLSLCNSRASSRLSSCAGLGGDIAAHFAMTPANQLQQQQQPYITYGQQQAAPPLPPNGAGRRGAGRPTGAGGSSSSSSNYRLSAGNLSSSYNNNNNNFQQQLISGSGATINNSTTNLKRNSTSTTTGGGGGAGGTQVGVASAANVRSMATLRVLSVLRHWVSKHSQDFVNDPKLAQMAQDFFHELIMDSSLLPAEHKAALQLQQMIQKATLTRDNQVDLDVLLMPPVRPSPDSIETLSALEIAEGMTYLDHKIFLAIKSSEFLGQAWMKADKAIKAPHILLITKRFNDVSRLVSSEIIRVPELLRRVAIIEKWTNVAHICRVIHNFNGVLQICAAFTNSAVFRLKKTWDKIPKTTKATIDQLQNLVSTDSRFRNMRDAISRCDPPSIPYVGMYLTDLSFIEEGTPNYSPEGLLNFSKMRMIAHVIREIQHLQNGVYKMELNPRVANYLLGDVRHLQDDEMYRCSLAIEPRSSNAKNGVQLLNSASQQQHPAPTTNSSVAGQLASGQQQVGAKSLHQPITNPSPGARI